MIRQIRGKQSEIRHQLTERSLYCPAISVTTRNKYQALQDMQDPGDPIDASWDSLKKVWTEAGEEIFGQKKQYSKAWISKDIISKVILKRSKNEKLNRACTRLQKERAHAEYTEANKDVKKV